MVGDTCVPSLIVISTAINQLETNVSLITICSMRLLVVVCKHLHIVFDQGSEMSMHINFCSHNFYTF